MEPPGNDGRRTGRGSSAHDAAGASKKKSPAVPPTVGLVESTNPKPSEVALSMVTVSVPESLGPPAPSTRDEAEDQVKATRATQIPKPHVHRAAASKKLYYAAVKATAAEDPRTTPRARRRAGRLRGRGDAHPSCHCIRWRSHLRTIPPTRESRGCTGRRCRCGQSRRLCRRIRTLRIVRVAATGQRRG